MPRLIRAGVSAPIIFRLVIAEATHHTCPVQRATRSIPVIARARCIAGRDIAVWVIAVLSKDAEDARMK